MSGRQWFLAKWLRELREEILRAKLATNLAKVLELKHLEKQLCQLRENL